MELKIGENYQILEIWRKMVKKWNLVKLENLKKNGQNWKLVIKSTFN